MTFLCAVLLLVMGLYVFVNGDANGSPEGTKFGIILVTVAMFCGGNVLTYILSDTSVQDIRRFLAFCTFLRSVNKLKT